MTNKKSSENNDRYSRYGYVRKQKKQFDIITIQHLFISDFCKDNG